MKCLWFMLLLAAILLCSASYEVPIVEPEKKATTPQQTADKKPEAEKQAPMPLKAASDEFNALQEQYRKGTEEFSKAYSEAKTEAAKRTVAEKLGDKASAQAYTSRFLKFAQKYPQDPIVFEVFSWLLARARHDHATDATAELIIKHHIKSSAVEKLCRTCWYYPSPAGAKVLRAALKASPHRDVQGYARYSLAAYLTANQESIAGAGEEAEKLLDEVIENYANLKNLFGDGNLGDSAKPLLFEVRFLSIGKVAPEIEGEDIDGKRMKLSDYRGKVVLLDFWGHW